MTAAGPQPLMSDGSNTTTSYASHLRPNIVRRETDHILSYYQSELAGKDYNYAAEENANPPAVPAMRSRQSSSGSNSSSQYSSHSLDRHADDSKDHTYENAGSAKPPPSAPATMGHTRRPSQPSEGGADRRRLAIVELDSTSSSSLSRKDSGRLQAAQPPLDGGRQPMAANGLLSRRRIHVDGLALVAPPDASPYTYTDLTPPTTAPVARAHPHVGHVTPGSSLHQRSRSEAVHVTEKSLNRKGSRDVGIVGTRMSMDTDSTASSIEEERVIEVDSGGLKVPIFQTPTKSRTPSPSGRTGNYSESSTPGVGPYGNSYINAPNGFIVNEPLLTPAIGESKDIRQPVVGPVVVGLSPSTLPRNSMPGVTSQLASSSDGLNSPSSYTRNTPSPYLYYEPGVHSTAGPLPPPPAQKLLPNSHSPTGSTSPPPRPPRSQPMPHRNVDALREALQLPKSVSAKLTSRFSVSPEPSTRPRIGSRMDSSESRESDVSSSSSQHRRHLREGAFPPSTICTTSSQTSTAFSDQPESTTSISRHDSVHSVHSAKRSPVPDGIRDSLRIVNSIPREDPQNGMTPPRPSFGLRHEGSWVSLGESAVDKQMSPNGGAEKVLETPPAHSPSPPPRSPTPPPKGRTSEDERGGLGKPLKSALTNMKRFSALPRTPSATSSVKTPSSQSSGALSPPAKVAAPKVRIVRRKAAWPDAMQCRDVTLKKSTLERSQAYAHKINELAMYDCGLSEWVAAVKYRGPASASPHNSNTRIMITPATPSVHTHTTQPRQMSHGSVASEVTFPIRPDAYTATDLSARAIDVAPAMHTPPAALPYPSLAQSSQAMRTSTLLASPSHSIPLPLPGPKSGIGFFSSLGRKTSHKDKDRSAPPTPSVARVLTKRNHDPVLPPKPVQISSSPSVPGGPRAAPGRVKRSQTYSAAMAPPVRSPPEPTPLPDKRMSNIGRRPSLFTRSKPSPGPSPATYTKPSPEFVQQVDKLADLLPHADRDILAAYLRRAGQDMLAIGQYLEDEKNGVLRRD